MLVAVVPAREKITYADLTPTVSSLSQGLYLMNTNASDTGTETDSQ